MKKRRNRFTQNQPPEERLVEHAMRLREEAKTLPPGPTLGCDDRAADREDHAQAPGFVV
jgi:hypothetical protein